MLLPTAKAVIPAAKWLALTAVMAYFVALAVLVGAGLTDHIADADVIVVPGNAVMRNGEPSQRLQARLDAALVLFRAKHAPLIFVSGGKGQEGFDEADSMANYLLKKGVPASAIVKDGKGVNTDATGRNVAIFMREKNLKTALVATQYFHIPRTKLALEHYQVQVQGNLHPRYFEVRDVYSAAREVIGYAAYMTRYAFRKND